MKRYQTKAIVLRRTNYAEYDRIITLLTPSHGKVSAMAKGVRKPKSRLAGGIELLSVCNLSLVGGKGNLETLVSSRMVKHYHGILSDYPRLEFAYEALRLVDKLTEQKIGSEYFRLLEGLFESLGSGFDLSVCRSWFLIWLLKVYGCLPNLDDDENGDSLKSEKLYQLNSSRGVFIESTTGHFDQNSIKAWRLALRFDPEDLVKITGVQEAMLEVEPRLLEFVQSQLN